MSATIGIRHEDKYLMERRAPLTPEHIRKLKDQHGLNFIIESSDKRVFTDSEYKEAGAEVESNLKNCHVVFGVKEIPENKFESEKTYIFFSHVIKGQPYNMPMLKKMMELKCNLIDYERIVDDQNRRLIFFGKFAGLAGMINSLWSLGQRLKRYGYDTPFLKIEQSFKYDSLAEAKKVISKVGQEIAELGLPEELCPLTIGFTGYGNVSVGAQEIASLLPVKEIMPDELIKLKERKNIPNNVLYKVIFKEDHLSERKDSNPFDLQDYYKNPGEYRSIFEQYLPHLTVLMNCMYWDDRYPRIVTKDYLQQLFDKGRPKMTVIGDITCDPDGSVEITHEGTPIEDPVFVYNPATRKPSSGFDGEGMLVMAVDILPSELPRDSSIAFADALMDFVKPIAEADFNQPTDSIELPKPIEKALILHKGNLTNDYKYIENYLK